MSDIEAVTQEDTLKEEDEGRTSPPSASELSEAVTQEDTLKPEDEGRTSPPSASELSEAVTQEDTLKPEDEGRTSPPSGSELSDKSPSDLEEEKEKKDIVTDKEEEVIESSSDTHLSTTMPVTQASSIPPTPTRPHVHKEWFVERPKSAQGKEGGEIQIGPQIHLSCSETS